MSILYLLGPKAFCVIISSRLSLVLFKSIYLLIFGLLDLLLIDVWRKFPLAMLICQLIHVILSLLLYVRILLLFHKFMIVLSPWWIVLWKVWLVLYILAVRLGHLTSSGECTVRRGDMFHLWGATFMPLFLAMIILEAICTRWQGYNVEASS